MLFSASTSNLLNTPSSDSLNTSLPQTNSAALSSSTVASGLIDPLQASLKTSSSASDASIRSAGGTPATALSSPADLVSLNPQPLPPRVSTSTGIDDQLTANTLNTGAIVTPVDPGGIIPRIIDFLGTEGGSTMDTATNLGSLTETPRSLTAYRGVSTTAPNDYYRVTLGENSNFNLSMTGLSADADVQFLNSVGTEIARSAFGVNHDEAINLSGLAAGDYYIRVYQYSGNTGFSLDLSSANPSNLLPHEFELGTVGSGGTTQTGFLSNSNTADVYHFSVNGYYEIGSGDVRQSGFDTSSTVDLYLTGLSADADVRIIRDANHNGLIDPGEEIVRSARGGTYSEAIHLTGLGVGDYFAEVYQYSGDTSYALNLSANGGRGQIPASNNDTLSQAYDVNTLNGPRAFSGHVNGTAISSFGLFPGLPANPNDFLHFNLGATSNFNLSLTGMSADADVYLLNSSGIEINRSTIVGTSPEAISQTLAAGDYYVQVHAFSSNSTDYKLNLNAVPVPVSNAVGSGDLTSISSFTAANVAADPLGLLNLSPAEQQADFSIDLSSSFYQADGNTFVAGNNQFLGAHPFQCVEYAYGRAMELGLFQNQQDIGAVLNGDAGIWDDDLIGTAYSDRLHLQAGAVDSQARANSMVVWEGNLNLLNTHPDGSWETFTTGLSGHVGFVEAVYDDGSYLVSEANVNGQPFHLSYIMPDSAQYNEAEFIYL